MNLELAIFVFVISFFSIALFVAKLKEWRRNRRRSKKNRKENVKRRQVIVQAIDKHELAVKERENEILSKTVSVPAIKA